VAVAVAGDNPQAHWHGLFGLIIKGVGQLTGCLQIHWQILWSRICEVLQVGGFLHWQLQEVLFKKRGALHRGGRLQFG
jgi:hypothetical protein